MFIVELLLQIFIVLVPALLSVLFYERLKRCRFTLINRIILSLVFALFITLVVYVSFWLRGWENIGWTMEVISNMGGISFILFYVIVSLAAAAVLPFLLSLVMIVDSKIKIVMGNKQELVLAGIIFVASVFLIVLRMY